MIKGEWKMTYEIVLKSGTVVICFAKDFENVVEMIFKHDIFIVAENSRPNYSTYIRKEDVDYFRFPMDAKEIAKPVI